MREFIKRRDNRLTIENLSVVETYIERWLSMICDFEIFGTRYCVDPATLGNKEVKPPDTSTVVVLSACTSEFNDRNDRNQQLMLVHDVEVVNQIRERLPSVVSFNRNSRNTDAAKLSPLRREEFSDVTLNLGITKSSKRGDHIATRLY